MSIKIGVINNVIGEQGVDALRVAKELGFEGVEFFLPAPWEDDSWLCPDFQKTLRDAAAEQGVEIPSLALAYMNSCPLASPDKPARWAVLQAVIEHIKVAEALGAREILLAFYGAGELAFGRQGDILVEQLKAAASAAEKAGVGLGIESTLTSKQYLDIIERVGSPAVNVYLDMCNPYNWMLDTGEQLRSLGDKVGQIHFKEGPSGEDLGEGFNDWDDITAALKEINFDGWGVLETGSHTGDRHADAKKNLERARELAARCV